MSSDRWQAVIGLEIHAQLNTHSKIFSSDSAEFGGGDNEHVSAVSLGLPGTLPVLNKSVVEYAAKIGLALNCRVNNFSEFSRKNYFYPDLPKGYQISQYDKPVCEDGYIEFFHNDKVNRIKIQRAHLEEDAGKSIHQTEGTLLNFNRAGVPLLEIVSAPEINSGAQAAEYARAMRQILLYLNACDGNLEEGSLRCDCNVSVKRPEATVLGTRVEIKNLNSFRFIEKAVEYEIARQIDCLESGQKLVQETRLYDSTKNKTYTMRSKEDAEDYRYFPDPDLLPLHVEEKWLEDLKKSIPELPFRRAYRFKEEHQLPDYDVFFLTQEKELADFFEETIKAGAPPKEAANWLMGEFWRELKENQLSMNQAKVTPKLLNELIQLIESGKISNKLAKQVFLEMWSTGDSPQKIVVEKGWLQISDKKQIEKIVDEVIAGNPDQVASYLAGRQKVYGFFVGQVMQKSQGKASPEVVNQLLKEKLK